MIVTEKEAKKLACPKMFSYEMIVIPCCLGSKCMWWVWRFDGDAKMSDKEKGFCRYA